MSKAYFSGDVIQRFMNAQEFSQFCEKYYANKREARTARPVNDQDRQILADYRAKMSIKDLRVKYQISESRIQTSILKAAQE